MAEEAGFAMARDNGSTDIRIKEQRQRQTDDDAIDYLASVAQQDAQRRDREREEWAKQTHALAGQKLTGREWAEMSEELGRDGKGREWLTDYLVRRGQARQLGISYYLPRPVADADLAIMRRIDELHPPFSLGSLIGNGAAFPEPVCRRFREGLFTAVLRSA